MIEFELTETALFQNAGRVRSLLEKLMEMGFGVSIDDFGAGYSSLNVLPSIPANILKLDKGFLQGRGFNERNRTLVRHMISMAVDLNFRVICEGSRRRRTSSSCARWVATWRRATISPGRCRSMNLKSAGWSDRPV